MSRPPKSHKLRYITRMDYERTRGWWVRFFAGTTLLEGALFSDKKHGGKKKALLAAQSWRDAHEGTWVSKKPGRLTYVSQNRRNVTGVVGVVLRIDPERQGLARFSWAALWSDGGSQHTRSFGVVAHGYQRGFQMAIDHRLKMLGVPRFEKRPPPWKRVLANRTY